MLWSGTNKVVTSSKYLVTTVAWPSLLYIVCQFYKCNGSWYLSNLHYSPTKCFTSTTFLELAQEGQSHNCSNQIVCENSILFYGMQLWVVCMHSCTIPVAGWFALWWCYIHTTYLQFFKELSSCIGAWTPEDPQLCMVEEGLARGVVYRQVTVYTSRLHVLDLHLESARWATPTWMRYCCRIFHSVRLMHSA